MPTEDRRIGKLMPIPVTPADTVCFTIQIPNAVQYRAAFLGQINVLGQALTWDHPTDGTYCADCEEAAQLWRNAIYESTFSDDCEMDMNCGDVADCIENNAEVQAALAAQNSLGGASGGAIYNTSYIGAPMSAAQRNTVVGFGEDCALDNLFGSVTAIIDQLDTNNRDFLEVILLTDNAQQRVSKIIKAIPLLNEVPIDEALDFVSQMSTEIKEGYDAAYTTALRDTYRCAIFCIAKEKPDCAVTFQDLVKYFNDRIGTSLEPINFFVSLVQYFTTGTWSGTQIVDILTLIQLSVWQQASNWTGISLRSLQIVGFLGANDEDPDWEILCEDCADEPRVPVINSIWDSAHVAGIITGPDSEGLYTVTTTTRTSDEAFTIMDEEDRDFVLTDITYSAAPTCQVFVLDGTPFYIACPGYDVYTGQTVDEFHSTFAPGIARTMTFKMRAP